jgi:hypothetical protein
MNHPAEETPPILMNRWLDRIQICVRHHGNDIATMKNRVLLGRFDPFHGILFIPSFK